MKEKMPNRALPIVLDAADPHGRSDEGMTHTMNAPRDQGRRLDKVERQALDWVRRLAAGRMTHADGELLKRWCRADPAHAAAFATAQRRWQQLVLAGEMVLARDPDASRAGAARTPAETRRTPRAQVDRRRFLGGMVGAAGATAVAFALVEPPLGLWPSARELRADYRTATGEQRRVMLAGNVPVELNTRTSIALRGSSSSPGFDLIAGEAAIDASASANVVEVAAGAARTRIRHGQVEVRRMASLVCVTCINGQATVVHAAGTVPMRARQQLTYDDRALQALVNVDAEAMPAWREGYLRFRDTPLGDVINEINRYRPGKVVLLKTQLETRPVNGRFQIHALDNAIVQIERSFGLMVRNLPGGVVLLG